MTSGQSLPLVWLLSDARNDAALEDALERLPRGSGFVFRHYHLEPDRRRDRYEELAEIARSYGHLAIVSGDIVSAQEWGADGVYGSVGRLGQGGTMIRLATAHDGDELQRANAAGVDGVFLSPVFATRSHSGAATLGIEGFHGLAMQSAVPVIALGGMTRERASALDWPRWGAVDGLA